MQLNEKQRDKFYKIWGGLLDFTNKKYKIAPKLKDIQNAKSLDPHELVPIKNKMWEDKKIIDEYLEKYENLLSQSDIDIIKSWKNVVQSTFIILKHLKNYTVFMDEKEEKLYGVVGLSNPIEDMFHKSILPVQVKAVLVPFEGKVIYDSIILPYNISFGPGIKRRFNEQYKSYKENYGILTTL